MREKELNIEALAAETHQIYCQAYKERFGKEYWTGGDYSKLDEPTKEYDRLFVKWAISRFSKPPLRLPEKLKVPEFSKCPQNEQTYWYNKALDDVKRLNGGDE